MQEWILQLKRQSRQFAEVLAVGDLAAAVPSCPGWTLAELGDHVGGIYQWAAHAIVAGSPDAVVQPAPQGRQELVDWYTGHAGRLVDVLGSRDAGDPAWGFGPMPRTVAFWARRQVHETAMHLWDAHASQGTTHDLPEQLAADGVDEVLTVFFPRQVRLGRIPPLMHTLALDLLEPGSATGSAPSRFVLSGDGTGSPGGDPDAVVSGPAAAVLLLLWNRITLDDARLTLTGDPLAAAAVLSAGVVP